MNKREAKIEALFIIRENVRAAIDSGTAYGEKPSQEVPSKEEADKIEAAMLEFLFALDTRIERLVGA